MRSSAHRDIPCGGRGKGRGTIGKVGARNGWLAPVGIWTGNLDFLPNAFVNGVNRAEVELVYG